MLFSYLLASILWGFFKTRDNLPLSFLFKKVSEEESRKMTWKSAKLQRKKYNYLYSQIVWLYMWKTTNIQQKNENLLGGKTNEQIQEDQDTKSTPHFPTLTKNNLKKKWRKTVPLTTALKRINYLGINLIQEVKDVPTESCRPLKKTNKWEDIQCSWIARFNIVKMQILSKVTSGVNATPVQIPVTFFCRETKTHPTIHVDSPGTLK